MGYHGCLPDWRRRACCTAAIGAGALNQQRYREKLHLTDQTDTPSENFTAIQVALEDADLTVQTGESVSVEAENISADCYDVTVRDGVLRIEQRSNDLNQYTLIHLGGFSIPTAKITLTLPEENYKSMDISASYGDCTVDGISARHSRQIWTAAAARSEYFHGKLHRQVKLRRLAAVGR
ncbi:MAG: DUF4097 family beta strand repeat-containing protein [Ruminococcus callidus]